MVSDVIGYVYVMKFLWKFLYDGIRGVFKLVNLLFMCLFGGWYILILLGIRFLRLGFFWIIFYVYFYLDVFFVINREM